MILGLSRKHQAKKFFQGFCQGVPGPFMDVVSEEKSEIPVELGFLSKNRGLTWDFQACIDMRLF
ncbi:MAG: hypothetical protein IKO41_14160 [Lachnospiraceae bacterium]|nr:hypothetical protein [Lachnospiraceae bacterium]